MNNVLDVLSVGVGDAAWVLLGRLGVDLFFTALTVRVVYYRLYRSRDFQNPLPRPLIALNPRYS